MSPAEIVDQYTEQVYHQRDLTSLDMLLADPMIRHEPDGTRLALTLEEAKLRITSFHQQFRSMRFSNRMIIQDQESVAAGIRGGFGERRRRTINYLRNRDVYYS